VRPIVSVKVPDRPPFFNFALSDLRINDLGMSAMNRETLLAFALFALAAPGPNNIILMISRDNHGFRAGLPNILGVAFGFALLLMCTGFGLSELFTRFTGIYLVTKWLGVIYFIYYAWKLASPMQVNGSVPTCRARRFHDAVAFQWINPKGWIMAVGAFNSCVPAISKAGVIVGAVLVFSLIAIPRFILWVCFGAHLRSYLPAQTLFQRRHNRLAARLASAAVRHRVECIEAVRSGRGCKAHRLAFSAIPAPSAFIHAAATAWQAGMTYRRAFWPIKLYQPVDRCLPC